VLINWASELNNIKDLKGQSHEKVGELRVWGVCLGPGYKNSYGVLNFSDRPFDSCEFSKFPFCLIKPFLIYTNLAPYRIPITLIS
jgi:hypothetical protein